MIVALPGLFSYFFSLGLLLVGGVASHMIVFAGTYAGDSLVFKKLKCVLLNYFCLWSCFDETRLTSRPIVVFSGGYHVIANTSVVNNYLINVKLASL